MNTADTQRLKTLVNQYLSELEPAIRTGLSLLQSGSLGDKPVLYKEQQAKVARLCDKRIAANRFKNVLENPVV